MNHKNQHTVSHYFVLCAVLIPIFIVHCTADNHFTDYLWTMDTEEELATYDNDRTGAIFKLNSNHFKTGKASVEVVPSGSSDDTNLALPLNGKRLSSWIDSDSVGINVYLPEENYINPDHFFLGMADVTGGGWSWVDGTNWNENELHDGWNKIWYNLPDSMAGLQEDGEYMIFISFSAFMPPRKDGVKVPLYESFYIYGIKTL